MGRFFDPKRDRDFVCRTKLALCFAAQYIPYLMRLKAV
jgi:hypothetical protein